MTDVIQRNVDRHGLAGLAFKAKGAVSAMMPQYGWAPLECPFRVHPHVLLPANGAGAKKSPA
jgi:hypothetical protein